MTKIKTTFMGAVSFFIFSANSYGGQGAIDCYRYARYRTDLSIPGASTDEVSIARLCRDAVDDSPASCYDEARRLADASKEAAILLCQPSPLCVLANGRLLRIDRSVPGIH